MFKPYSKEDQLNRGKGLHSSDIQKYKHLSYQGLKNKAIKIFNAWIRERDRNGDTFQCVSCRNHKVIKSLPQGGSNYHAGHFIPAGTCEALRFDEVNVNGECLQCNYFSGDHLLGYRYTIIKKWGEEQLKRIEMIEKISKRKSKKWSRIELVEIIMRYSE